MLLRVLALLSCSLRSPRADAPPPPPVAARAWLLVDLPSGQTIAAQNADERIEPASLTKLMTAYLVFDALKKKAITPEQTCTGVRSAPGKPAARACSSSRASRSPSTSCCAA